MVLYLIEKSDKVKHDREYPASIPLEYLDDLCNRSNVVITLSGSCMPRIISNSELNSSETASAYPFGSGSVSQLFKQGETRRATRLPPHASNSCN